MWVCGCVGLTRARNRPPAAGAACLWAPITDQGNARPRRPRPGEGTRRGSPARAPTGASLEGHALGVAHALGNVRAPGQDHRPGRGSARPRSPCPGCGSRPGGARPGSPCLGERRQPGHGSTAWGQGHVSRSRARPHVHGRPGCGSHPPRASPVPAHTRHGSPPGPPAGKGRPLPGPGDRPPGGHRPGHRRQPHALSPGDRSPTGKGSARPGSPCPGEAWPWSMGPPVRE